MSDPTPEQIAREVMRLHGDPTLNDSMLLPADLEGRIAAAIADAERRGAEAERGRIIAWVRDYIEECERCLREEVMPDLERRTVGARMFLAGYIVERFPVRPAEGEGE